MIRVAEEILLTTNVRALTDSADASRGVKLSLAPVHSSQRRGGEEGKKGVRKECLPA